MAVLGEGVRVVAVWLWRGEEIGVVGLVVRWRRWWRVRGAEGE